MRPDTEVMLVRMIAWPAVVFGRFFARQHGMVVITGFRIMTGMVVLDRTNGGLRGIVMVTNVCPRSGAAAHQVLSSECDEHH